MSPWAPLGIWFRAYKWTEEESICYVLGVRATFYVSVPRRWKDVDSGCDSDSDLDFNTDLQGFKIENTAKAGSISL